MSLPRRLTAGALAVVAVLAALAGTAAAVGASGVDMTPQLPRDRDGTYVLTVGGNGEPATLKVANLTDEPREIRVYAAAATLGTEPGSGMAIGGPGSLPWLPLDERRQLDGEETLEVPVPVTAQRGDVDDDTYVAFVLEVTRSSSLVTEAATVVRVRRAASLPIPSWLLIAAIVLLIIAATAWARFGRRQTVEALQPAPDVASMAGTDRPAGARSLS